VQKEYLNNTQEFKTFLSDYDFEFGDGKYRLVQGINEFEDFEFDLESGKIIKNTEHGNNKEYIVAYFKI